MIESSTLTLSPSILAITYFGDVVFSVSGALTAARYRMDVLGFVLIGTVTGIGGGAMRDLLLGRTVWGTHSSCCFAWPLRWRHSFSFATTSANAGA